jgi:hypothetical protein
MQVYDLLKTITYDAALDLENAPYLPNMGDLAHI